MIEIPYEILTLLKNNDLSKTDFLILCHRILKKVWPDQEYCKKEFKIGKESYRKSIKRCEHAVALAGI